GPRPGGLLATPGHGPVALQAGRRDLRPDVPLPLGDQFAGGLLDLLERLPAGVPVRLDRLAALPAEQLVHRHPGALAEDVPQGHVHAADGVAEDRPVAPVRADEARLPHVLDAERVLAEEERPEVLVDGGLDGADALGEGGAAEAVEPRLAGLDLDDDEADAGGRGEDG